MLARETRQKLANYLSPDLEILADVGDAARRHAAERFADLKKAAATYRPLPCWNNEQLLDAYAAHTLAKAGCQGENFAAQWQLIIDRDRRELLRRLELNSF